MKFRSSWMQRLPMSFKFSRRLNWIRSSMPGSLLVCTHCNTWNQLHFQWRQMTSRYRTQHLAWLASPRSEAQTHVCLAVGGSPWWVLLQHSGHSWAQCYFLRLCCDYFLLSSVASSAFSALCVYLKFGHHPHPLGYLCTKFCCFHDHHCWANPWRKITYSISQSLNHSLSLFDEYIITEMQNE